MVKRVGFIQLLACRIVGFILMHETSKLMMTNHFAEERWVCTEFQGISVNGDFCCVFPLLGANRLVLVLFGHSRASSFSESVFQTCCIPGFSTGIFYWEVVCVCSS